MKRDTMPQVARFWNAIAADFDAIYTGRKSTVGRMLDRYFRRDIFQRFDWVMRQTGDVRGKTICDIGCGSGRFVAEFGRREAAHITGIDVAPDMLALARNLVSEAGVADRCEFFNADILNWKASRIFDVSIAIGFWDYIMEPPERLRIIRSFTRETFLSAWPRYWTWRMPVRKIRLQYFGGCPVYFFKRSEVYKLIEDAGFQVESCEVIGKLFCVRARPV